MLKKMAHSGIIKTFVLMIGFLSLLSCKGVLLTTQDILRAEDTIPPEIYVNTPADNHYYGNSVRVEGRVTDRADDSGVAGKVIGNLFYEVLDTGVIAKTCLNPEGYFSFSFPATEFHGNKILEIKATDWKGNEGIARINLREETRPLLTAEAANKEITLSWAPQEGAATYHIYYTTKGRAPSSSSYEDMITTAETEYRLECRNGYTYSFIVMADCGEYGQWTSGVTKAVATSHFTFLPAVLPKRDSLQLSWAASPHTTSFIVSRSKKKSGPFTDLSSGITGTTYTDYAVTPGETYYYTVRASIPGSLPSGPGGGKVPLPPPLSPQSPFRSLATYSPEQETHENKLCDVTLEGQYMYLANYTAGLTILDISDPGHPGPAWNQPFLPGQTTYAYGITLYGQYAFVTGFYMGVRIIDITNPATPVLSSSPAADLSRTTGVTLAGDFLYVTYNNQGTDSLESGFRIYDISDPHAPLLLRDKQVGHSPRGPVHDKNRLYLATGKKETGIEMWNINDKSQPTSPLFLNTPGETQGLVLFDPYAALADGRAGISIFRLSQDDTPSLLVSIPGQHNVFTSDIIKIGAYLLATCGEEGLKLLDVTDPAETKTLYTHSPEPGEAFTRLTSDGQLICLISDSEDKPLHILEFQ